MEKVRRWIPFVFWEICLSDEKCGYEVVYWESFAEIKKRQFLVSDLEIKGVFLCWQVLSRYRGMFFNCLEQGAV